MFCQFLNLIHNILEIGLSGEFIQKNQSKIVYCESITFANAFQFFDLFAELDYEHYHRVKELIQRKSIGIRHLENMYKKIMNSNDDFYFLTPVHPDFPRNFYELNPCPFGVYVQGSRLLLKTEKVAIVGSRKASFFALQESEYIGKHLAMNGFVVVSGGALGCDIAGHIGALRSNKSPCPAIVVFASGLLHLYPRQNEDVFMALKEKQALFISEKPPDFFSLPRDFPRRNRLIISLAKEVVVIQCGLKSGAMNSVQHALQYGKDIHVLRQQNDIRADGCEKLIEEGVSHFKSGQEYLYGR